MKRLFLLRHAKSSWDDPDLRDHDRPLAPRGVRATSALSDYIRSGYKALERVEDSTQRRAGGFLLSTFQKLNASRCSRS